MGSSSEHEHEHKRGHEHDHERELSKTVIDVKDMWMEIFKRLHVKNLCRFRCACKSWNSLISSSWFITLHHKYSVSCNKEKSFFLISHEECVHVVDYALYHPQRSVGQRFTYFDLPFLINPYKSEFECVCFRVCGVIHGVLCLALGENIVVWNPATHKYISRRYSHAGERGVIGFGFDATKNDFKVVFISCSGPWYDVLLVKDGFWRRKQLSEDIYRNYMPRSQCCFIKGTIYWVAIKRGCSFKDPSLLVFDCEREEFRSIKLPQILAAEYKDRTLQGWWLFKHDGMPTLIMRNANLWEVWVMEEEEGYSVGTSTWKKLFTLKSAYELLGKGRGLSTPTRRRSLTSDDVSAELGRFRQPLVSQEFEESLYLADVKTQIPQQFTPLTCEFCHRLVYYC